MSNEVDSKMMREAASSLPSTEKLEEIASLAQQLIAAKERQTEFEAKAANEYATVKKLSEEVLPNLMGALCLEEITLTNGLKLKCVPVFGASVPDERKPEAWQWLRANGYGPLIKTDFKLSYGMGEEITVSKVNQLLEDNGLTFAKKEDVHPATLKAFVKEMFESGKTFPQPLFGAFTKPIAQIKSKK